MSLARLISALLTIYLATGCSTPRPDHQVSAAPGSDTNTLLLALYDPMEREYLAKRLANIKSPFDFFRSFVPYYYHIWNQEPFVTLGPLKELNQIQGWCAGDAHPENFGYLLDQTGAYQYTLDDIDDSGPCPLLADFTRYLVSVRLTQPAISLEPIIGYYLMGLRQKPIQSSLPEILKPPVGEAAVVPKNWQPDSSGFLPQREGSQKLDQDQIVQLNMTMQRQGYASVQDAVISVKLTGGSGGLIRIVALLANPDGRVGTPRLVELKETRKPGIWPTTTTQSLPSVADRYRVSLDLTQPKAPSSYGIVTFEGRTFFVRPKFQEQKAPPADLPVLLSQAYILGSLHHKTASKLYADIADRVPISDWNALTDHFTTIINRIAHDTGAID